MWNRADQGLRASFESIVTDISFHVGRAVVAALCMMIFPTMMKEACPNEGCAPVVEVWDGNMKDVQKLKGSLLQLAAEADRRLRTGAPAAALAAALASAAAGLDGGGAAGRRAHPLVAPAGGWSLRWDLCGGARCVVLRSYR